MSHTQILRYASDKIAPQQVCFSTDVVGLELSFDTLSQRYDELVKRCQGLQEEVTNAQNMFHVEQQKRLQADREFFLWNQQFRNTTYLMNKPVEITKKCGCSELKDPDSDARGCDCEGSCACHDEAPRHPDLHQALFLLNRHLQELKKNG